MSADASLAAAANCIRPLGEPFPCLLLVDAPAPGAWNMAVDEALLDAAADASVAALRFYRWSSPTLSLGYFQPFACREEHPPSLPLEVVRRLSGGGALVHDQELTYALCLPAAHPLAQRPPCAYSAVHHALIEVLARQGITAELAGEAPAVGEEPFLCFRRRSNLDVVGPLPPASCRPAATAPPKICGSAQRRRRGALLQHGSLLRGASRAAPDLLGIDDLVASAPPCEQLVGPWSHAIAAACGLRLEAPGDGFRTRLAEAAERLAGRKYRAAEWTRRR
jgi:lipoate-protein ligase A